MEQPDAIQGECQAKSDHKGGWSNWANKTAQKDGRRMIGRLEAQELKKEWGIKTVELIGFMLNWWAWYNFLMIVR
jgi:hypothetical protein